MRETCDSCRESPAHIGINEGHFRRLVEIFIVHILDQVQGVYIQTCQPVHHHVILADYLIIIQILRGNGAQLRPYLLLCFHIPAAIHSI